MRDVARVKLNGSDLGIVWAAPWRVEIPAGLLKAKGNALELEVANCWPNRLIGDGLLPNDRRRTVSNIRTYDPVLSNRGWVGTGKCARGNCKLCKERMKAGVPPRLLPSGLMGPVKICSAAEAN